MKSLVVYDVSCKYQLIQLELIIKKYKNYLLLGRYHWVGSLMLDLSCVENIIAINEFVFEFENSQSFENHHLSVMKLT